MLQQHREIAAFLRTRKDLGRRYSTAGAVRFQPVDNSAKAAGAPVIRIYGSA